MLMQYIESQAYDAKCPLAASYHVFQQYSSCLFVIDNYIIGPFNTNFPIVAQVCKHLNYSNCYTHIVKKLQAECPFRGYYNAHQQAFTWNAFPVASTLSFSLYLFSCGYCQAGLCRIGIYQAHGIVI